MIVENLRLRQDDAQAAIINHYRSINNLHWLSKQKTAVSEGAIMHTVPVHCVLANPWQTSIRHFHQRIVFMIG